MRLRRILLNKFCPRAWTKNTSKNVPADPIKICALNIFSAQDFVLETVGDPIKDRKHFASDISLEIMSCADFLFHHKNQPSLENVQQKVFTTKNSLKEYYSVLCPKLAQKRIDLARSIDACG